MSESTHSDESEHTVEVFGGAHGWVHHCTTCGYRGPDAPPLPCPGLQAERESSDEEARKRLDESIARLEGGPDGFTPLAETNYRAAFFRVLERCDELKAKVAEHQWNALEMARKADAAERRAEEAEFHVEQLRDARDRAEVLAEKLANDAALVRLAQAEALRTAAREFVDEMADAWGGDSQWLSTGTRVAEVVACVLREMAADLENGDAHV